METKEAKGESRMMPNWLELPLEVTTNIVQRLSVIEIVTSVSQVCPQWRKICKDPPTWRTIDMSNLRHSPYDLEKICRYVIKLSCGNLEDINIEYFGNDDLLEYIADSTRQLRRLGLANCQNISDEGVIKNANKFPLLEELDISYSYFITNNSIEVIGRCCPLLKSLKYSRLFLSEAENNDEALLENDWPAYDDEAFAIANSMPNLRFLNIYGNFLSNNGLLAILDGCPLLESLDLRGCCYLDWSGSLKQRCIQQIQYLKPPTYSVNI